MSHQARYHPSPAPLICLLPLGLSLQVRAFPTPGPGHRHSGFICGGPGWRLAWTLLGLPLASVDTHRHRKARSSPWEFELSL